MVGRLSIPRRRCRRFCISIAFIGIFDARRGKNEGGILHTGGTFFAEDDEGRVRRLLVEHLGNEVDVGNEGSLEDVGMLAIEQFDRVGTFESTRSLKLDGQVDPPPLHVNMRRARDTSPSSR